MKEYVSNKELYKELIISKAMGKLTPDATRMIILIVNRVSSKFYYKHSEDREDCKSNAILRCLRFWKNFDEEKTTNAFAFFTEIIKRAMAQEWNTLEKYREDYSLNQFYKTDGDYNI